MISLALAALMSFRASPDTIRTFPLDSTYTEIDADPGRVDEVCYDAGYKDSGLRKNWNDSYCGCTDLNLRIVWIARKSTCNARMVRDHENCHIKTGLGKAERWKCESEFRTS